jgi:tetratricopeptide (TPR) repeat protein
VLLAHYGAVPAAAGFGKAREYAEAALAQSPEADDALVHLAAVAFFLDWDFDRAEQLIERALVLHPANGIGLVMAANIDAVNRRGERAQSHMDRALEVDPLNVGLLMNSGDHLILQCRFAEAVQALTEALRIEPSFRPARLRMALALAFEGQGQQALACIRDTRSMGGEDAACLEYLAIVQGALGQTDAAGDTATRLENLREESTAVTPWALARAWASAGEQKRAIRYLQAAYEARSSSIPFLGITPVFGKVRELPEAQELMARIGLP